MGWRFDRLKIGVTSQSATKSAWNPSCLVMTKRCQAIAAHDQRLGNGLATGRRQWRNMLKVNNFSLPRTFGNDFDKLLICQGFS
jgi:hypothetical protein